MEKLFMSAGVVATIVLCTIGIIKLPFKKLKENHKNIYKTLFSMLSYVLAIALAVLDELFILNGKLLSVEFAILLVTIIAGVAGGYNLYEGTQLKTLVKKIVEKIKEAKSLSKDKKVVKFLDKIEDIDKAISLLEQRKLLPQDKVEEDIVEDIVEQKGE
jgi:multisubunit Na+/H+ antiporter MnhG subunit